MMEYVIGVDGGGTKTVAVIADNDGNIKASVETGPTNPNIVNGRELKSTFQRMFQKLKDQAPKEFHHVTNVFAGMSGVGTKQKQADIYMMITDLLPPSTCVHVEPDTMNALYSGTYGKPGIVQIAGTGSITHGINKYGEHFRIGGWGYLFGDEGSGYDLGRRAIIAVLQSEDGLGAKTLLTELLFKHFNVTSGRELLEKIYTRKRPKDGISALTKIIFHAYNQQDSVTSNFIHNIAKQLSFHITTVYNQLFEDHEQIQVVLVGGVFSVKEILPSLVKKELKSTPSISVCIPNLSPVGGSVVGAFLQQQKVLHKRVIENIKYSLID